MLIEAAWIRDPRMYLPDSYLMPIPRQPTLSLPQ
jgi:hypothetical protein